MCGIAGIIYRDRSLIGSLGADLTALIQPLESRGPDSSGMALYTQPAGVGQVKLILRGEAEVDWGAVQAWVEQTVPVLDTHVAADERRFLLDLANDLPFQANRFRRALRQAFPQIQVMSLGQGLEIYKEVGAVENLVHKYSLAAVQGTHGIAHTRMATESVVDIDHCHPFTTSFDLAIVHNGQISNYYRLRFQLERAGLVFETDNDSEAIVNYIHYQLQQGHSLEESLEALLHDIDGTYTFLVATADQVALVRDKFAAKPAVIYEAADRVAIASEYRALLQLSAFDPSATIREPDAGEINVWPISSPTQTPVSLAVAGR